jgi:hypothetical protein
MPNYSSSHMLDSPYSFFHTNMIAPSVLGVKIIGRLDSILRDVNIILKVDQAPVKRLVTFISIIRRYKKGDTVLFLNNREGATLFVTLKISK